MAEPYSCKGVELSKRDLVTEVVYFLDMDGLRCHLGQIIKVVDSLTSGDTLPSVSAVCKMMHKKLYHELGAITDDAGAGGGAGADDAGEAGAGGSDATLAREEQDAALARRLAEDAGAGAGVDAGGVGEAGAGADLNRVLASSVVTALAEQEARDAALARRLAGAGAAADLNRVLALSRETARAEQVARDATLARKMQAEEDARVASAPAPVPAPAPAPAGALPDGRIPVPPPSRAGDEAYEFALQAEREFAQRERARRPRRGIPVAALLYPWRLDG